MVQFAFWTNAFSFSLVCSAPPVGPVFANVNTTVSEDGAAISWEYFGHHKNVFVEYMVENSKASLCIYSLHTWALIEVIRRARYLRQGPTFAI